MAKKGLKRGLEHLFEENNSINSQKEEDLQEIQLIQIDEISPNPYQPRKNFDEQKIDELAKSIVQNGVFQPILVRKNILGYEIISGERRWRASKIADLKEIPAIVYNYDDIKMQEVAIIENIQREDLSILEEANSYKKLIQDLDYTQEKLAKKLGISRSHISNLIRITNLDNQILESLTKKEISLGHAKILAGQEDSKIRLNIFETIIKDKLNVRQTEELIHAYAPINKDKKSKKNIKNNSNFSKIEEIMIGKLSTKVRITGQNQGTIKINYDSVEDLERLLDLLKIIEE